MLAAEWELQQWWREFNNEVMKQFNNEIMLRIFSVLLMLFFISTSYAQDTIYLHNVDDTIVTTKEKALYYKTISVNESPIEVITYYNNGVKISNIHYSSLKPEIKNGEYETYFYNGKTDIKGIYQDNKMEGTWLVYNKEKNFIELKAIYKNNLRNGRSFIFYENGKLRRMDIYLKDTVGLSTCYDSVGNIIDCPPTEILDNSLSEKMPIFPGGVPALMSFLQKNLKYPQQAREDKIEGKVVVKCYIDVDGTVREPAVIKNDTNNNELAKEAIRVILSMPKWNPGIQKGKPVKSR